MNRFKVLDEDLEGNSIMEAVGFNMKHLKSVSFSRLPENIQVEVIEELDVAEKIKLVNVTSGFREYIARKSMADSKMEKDPIRKAFGFMMDSLKAVSFSRLPGNIQLEVIGELEVEEKIKLVNVTSGFREHFARSGIFGAHVDTIEIDLREKSLENSEEYGLRLRIFIEKEGRWHDFNLLKERALFRNISSCTKFILNRKYIRYERINTRRMEEFLRADENVLKIAEWFPNLRFVEQLTALRWGNPLVQEVLESFRFKVTDFAEFTYPSRELLESNHWDHLLANQLSTCENVWVRNIDRDSRVAEEIPGMEIENDPEKQNEILDAFKNKISSRLGLNWSYDRWDVYCYRRAIDENKEMIMVAQEVEIPFSR